MKPIHLSMTFILFLILTGCASVRIKSDPPGAIVYYSESAMGPWKILGEKAHPARTPATFRRASRSALFFRVEKEGYLASRPLLAETYPFHREYLSFKLEKTTALLEREYREKGLVRIGDKWVNPLEAGLVQYNGQWMTPAEKFAAEQKERGLIFYNGQWMTPEAKEVAFAAEQKNKGLVLFKNRWMTPKEKADEEAIDRQVEDAFAHEHYSSDTVRLIGVIPQEMTRVSLLNGSGQEVIFYLSGKKGAIMPLNPYETHSVDIPGGPYRIAAVPVTGTQRPSCWGVDFKPGNRYSILEEGEVIILESEPVPSPGEIKRKFNIPNLEIPDTTTTSTKERRAPRPGGREGPRRGGASQPSGSR
jgi:hypothetical protein